MEQINISAQHLARLIGDVLDLASSEAGQLHILREPLDLSEVFHVAAKIGEELAREKGLAWSVQLPRRCPWVIGDRTRLRQVTLNLISNAYNLKRYQMPSDNFEADRYEITATLAVGTTREQFREMLKNLLKERFKLAAHFVKKEVPGYEPFTPSDP
jgi:K+-sensing histidine kinase KdpD